MPRPVNTRFNISSNHELNMKKNHYNFGINCIKIPQFYMKTSHNANTSTNVF